MAVGSSARHFVAVVLRPPLHGVDAAERDDIHNRQVHACVRVASLANTADIVNAVLIAMFAVPAELAMFRYAWLTASVLLMANSPRMWWSRCWKAEFVATRTDLRKLTADVTANSLLIAVVLFVALPSADRYQQLIFLTAYAGVMGCGAIVLSTCRGIALLWVWLTGAALTAGVWSGASGAAEVLTALLLLYATVLSIAIALISWGFVTRCQAEVQARTERETVRTLLKDFEDDVNEWLWECDEAGALTHVSNTLAAQVGSHIGAFSGAHILTFVDSVLDHSSADAMQAISTLRDRFATLNSFRDVLVPVVVSGHRRWWSVTGHYTTHLHGGRWRGIGEDVTKATRSAQEVLRLATTDSLTGLMNRSRFTEVLRERLAIRPEPAQLAIVDLDNFKTVNDTLGHPLGDQLLIEVAGRLRALLDDGDLCARIGGDEFAIVRSPGPTGSRHFEDVLGVFDAPFTPSGTNLAIRASVGHALAPRDAVEVNDLVVAADLALYAAKAGGGARQMEFDAQFASDARDRAELIAELKVAIERREFVAWFQPQTNLLTGRVDALEALARWQHPTRGVVAPGAFIDVAEETGLIAEISQQVIDDALSAARRWPAHVRLAINVSPHQLGDADFVCLLATALQQHQVAAHRLDIEVTETTMVQRESTASLEALRELGVAISIDDFGTGYASYESLQLLRPSKLKIDRTFVAALDGPDPVASRAVLGAFVSLAHALGITSLAEGAETIEQRMALRQLGFHYSQGYIDGRPAPAASLEF